MRGLFFFALGILATVGFLTYHEEIFEKADLVQETAKNKLCQK